jgi:hypothetical protein
VRDDDPVDVRPLPLNRVLNALVWLALTALAVDPFVNGGFSRGVEIAGTAGSVLIGSYLAVRGYRAGVLLEPEAIVVRGFFRTRRIPKAQITGLTEFPAVRWKGADGKARWSPIVAFAEGGNTIPFVSRHNEASLERLRDWDDRRRLVARRNPAKKRRKR